MEYLVQWLKTSNDTIGMTPASAITTTFGAFCFAFTVCICWPKLVEDFKWAGGFIAAGIIVGTFWVMNHKLPGWGIAPAMREMASGDKGQFGLIHQAHNYGGPWIDMGFAAGFSLWISSIHGGGRPGKSLPTLAAVILGGLVGGALVGLIGFSGAEFSSGVEPYLSAPVHTPGPTPF
jgi:hypothetical protein